METFEVTSLDAGASEHKGLDSLCSHYTAYLMGALPFPAAEQT